MKERKLGFRMEWTKALDVRFVKLYTDGHQYREIAKRLGCSISAASQHRMVLGLPLRRMKKYEKADGQEAL